MEQPFSELISEEQIFLRIKEIGNELTLKFRDQKTVAICVLKGAYVFFADLVRHIQCDFTCDFLGVSSYQGGIESSGEVKMTLDLSKPIKDLHVLLIEDIVDTGLTMNYLKESLAARKPASITCITLLHKPDAQKIPCTLDYIGFSIPNVFVVGYGLDYEGKYRNLPFIARLHDRTTRTI